MDRSKRIIKTSVLGIVVNIVLVAFKATVGFIAGSIAVILDAVNNLSDALSSIITIIGTKLAGKAPDKKHPYGHGRVEYITSVIISVIVLIAGVTSGKESIEKIISPTAADYSIVSIIIIVAAIIAKLLMGRHVKKVGKEINSGALVASGSDALFDAILSVGTLLAAVISMIWHVSLEGWFGAVISIFILKAGIEMLVETVNSIIGIRADKEITDKLKDKVCEYPEVHGVYDITLHNYGPTQIIGSIHIEVDDDMTAKQIHKLTRAISADVYMTMGIVLTVGIYASNADIPQIAEIKKSLNEQKEAHEGILQIHGFYADTEQKTVVFDLVIDFKFDAKEIKDAVISEMSKKYPEYSFYAVIDSDYSDS